MDHPEATAGHDRAWGSAETRSRLTWTQRWLACATASAILLSGLNALVQVWRVAIEVLARHG